MAQVQITSANIENPSYRYSNVFESNTSVDDSQTIMVEIKDNPISIVGDKITILGQYVQDNRYYPFEYKGKKFLLYRPSKDVTEIYKVK
jgi:hypothetical protein